MRTTDEQPGAGEPADPDGDGLSAQERQCFHPDYLASRDPAHVIGLLRVLPSTSSDLIVIYDEQANLIYASPAAERILGFTSVSQVDRNVLEMVHPDDQERCVANMVRALSTPGVNPPAVYRVRTAAGTWRSLEVVATNCLDDPRIEGVVLNLRDVTRTVELRRAYATFGHANQTLLHATTEAELFERTCATIIDVGGYAEAWIGVACEDEARTVHPVAAAGRVAHLERVKISWADDEGGQGPVGRALRTNEPHAVRDLVTSRVPEHGRSLLEQQGLRACCALPIECGDGARRVLVIADADVRDFEEEELQLFGELADNLAFGLRELRSADALAQSEARFRTLAGSSPIGILEASAVGEVTYVNELMSEIAGREPSELLGDGWIEMIELEDRDELLSNLRRWGGRGILSWRCRIRTASGEVRHVQACAAPKADHGSDGYVVTIADVTEEVHAQEELTRLALVDPLTGLVNRTQFLARLDERLQRGRRSGDAPAILFLDLDHLKLINDSLGHEAGDAVITEAARRFVRVMRADELVARFGGDEFMFLVDDGRNARVVADRLLVALAEPFEVRGVEVSVTGSVGIARARRGDAADGLVRDADTALYRAKELGRNRVVVFDDELRARTLARLSIESDLSHALERDELDVEFQPIVETSSGRLVGAEALLRWRHPTRGVVPPLEFIGVAEDRGLIVDVGAWVLERAADQLSRWEADPDAPTLDFVAVNVSSRQLEHVDPTSWVRPALARSGVDAARIEIEVTETVAVGDLEAAKVSLEALRELGVTIAIDDFGTGYSSLSYLHSLPITTVKIDRSFVSRLLSEDGASPIVRAIVEMAHAMGLRVVAEGVSSSALFERVERLECDLAQGFAIARPMPPDAFRQWFASLAHDAASVGSR